MGPKLFQPEAYPVSLRVYLYESVPKVMLDKSESDLSGLQGLERWWWWWGGGSLTQASGGDHSDELKGILH